MSKVSRTSKISKVSLVVSGFISNILCVAGFLFGVPFVLVTFGGFMLVGFKAMFPSYFIFLAIDIACGFIVVFGIKIKQRIKRFKSYVYLISHGNKSYIKDLAKETGKSVEFVTKDLQLMIKLRYFTDAHISEDLQEIIIPRKSVAVNNVDFTPVSVVCKNCGGINYKQKNKVSQCEYCGSPIV